jgi:hypothetical protein
MELGQQENIDSILEGLEMIGSAKIGTEARVRGWIQWDREMVCIYICMLIGISPTNLTHCYFLDTSTMVQKVASVYG